MTLKKGSITYTTFNQSKKQIVEELKLKVIAALSDQHI